MFISVAMDTGDRVTILPSDDVLKVHFPLLVYGALCRKFVLWTTIHHKPHNCTVNDTTNCIGLSRYIAITNLSIIAVFVEYLRQFLIDLDQIYRRSSVPKTRLREFLELLTSSGFRARRRRDFFCHVVPVTV